MINWFQFCFNFALRFDLRRYTVVPDTEEERVRARAARVVRIQAAAPGWLNAHGLRHDFYTQPIESGAMLLDKPGWGGAG
jgi:hypothetical protein